MTENDASPGNIFAGLATWAVRATDERKKAADLAFEVAKAERNRTLLRFKIADRLIEGGASKTAAHDRARTNPEYIKASEEVDGLTNRWEHCYAEALGSQNAVSLALAQLAYQTGQERAKVELKAVQDFLQHRVRSLTPPDAALEAGE